MYAQPLNHVQLYVIPWTVAPQTPLSMEFSRQEYWIGLPFLSPWTLPDPWIETTSPTLSGRFFITEAKNTVFSHFLHDSNQFWLSSSIEIL